MQTLLVTGGAGFIGSHFVRHWLQTHPADRIVNLDALTYAGDLDRLGGLANDPRHRFVHGDICEHVLLARLFAEEDIHAVVHLAAESHVDRAIAGPAAFIRSNIEGTHALLEAARAAWGGDPQRRFLQVSTDEVYGELAADAPPCSEAAPFRPNNPYAASKAAADHLVRAAHCTYGLPTLVSHGSNTFGPAQHAEKLIPHMIQCALAGRPLPLYGNGRQIRDWLSVADHCRGLAAVLAHGQPGEHYNLGAGNPWRNIDLVEHLCHLLDERRPAPHPYRESICWVADRPGHDRRYAMDCRKARDRLGWAPRTDFSEGLAETLSWYLAHPPRG